MTANLNKLADRVELLTFAHGIVAPAAGIALLISMVARIIYAGVFNG